MTAMTLPNDVNRKKYNSEGTQSVLLDDSYLEDSDSEGDEESNELDLENEFSSMNNGKHNIQNK